MTIKVPPNENGQGQTRKSNDFDRNSIRTKFEKRNFGQPQWALWLHRFLFGGTLVWSSALEFQIIVHGWGFFKLNKHTEPKTQF